jgi:hypothetical protein
MAPLGFDPGREEIFQIKGDSPDPTGTGLLGRTASVTLTGGKIGVAFIRFRNLILEADVYQVGAEPLQVHLFCPRCQKTLRVQADQKAIDWTPPAPDRVIEGGVLSIAAFECTWELGDQTTLGAELCRQRLVVDRNVARVP